MRDGCAPYPQNVFLRGYQFELLTEPGLEPVISALDHPEIHRFVGDPRLRYPVRLERELNGESLTFVASCGRRVAGTAGVFWYPALERTLQTATILSPAFFGSSLNALGRLIQCQIATELQLPLVAIVDVDNARSVRATEKLHPHACPKKVWEQWMPRWAYLYRLGAPENVAPLGPAERETLAGEIRRSAFAARL